MADKLLSLHIIFIIFAMKVNMSICGDDDDDDGDLVGVFSTFLNDQSKRHMDSKEWTKLAKYLVPIGLPVETDLVKIFSECKEEKKSYLIVNKENIKKLLQKLAHVLAPFKRIDKASNQRNRDEAEAYKAYKAYKKKEGSASEIGTVGRLVAAKNYNGAQKERFKTMRKGKGVEGPNDLSENKGSYIGDYKGKSNYG